MESIETRLRRLENKPICCNFTFKDTLDDFPTVGILNHLYIDRSTGLIYVWDGDEYIVGIIDATITLTSVSATYAILTTDYTVNCTANTFTVTLPTAVGVEGKVYNIKNSGAGTITVATTSAQTIDGGASESITLVQYENLTVQSNNANWIIL